VDRLAFAQLLGPITKPHPTLSGDGKAVLPIDSDQSKASSWHTDVTFVDRVPAISVLRAIKLPADGGATVWANTAEAPAPAPGAAGPGERPARGALEPV
jgi:taurine dioxygenase